jgi:hypothetical protein
LQFHLLSTVKKTIHTHQNIILELVKHTDAVTSSNGYQNQAYADGIDQQNANNDGGNLLSLICGSLCKDTPLAEMFGPPPNDNVNNNATSQPLMTPIQNGEHICQDAQSQRNFHFTQTLWSLN